MLNLPIHLQLPIIASLYPSTAHVKARFTQTTNITIDDNDPTIFYSPGWNLTTSPNPLDYGGHHHLSNQSSAFAVFNFTGVGVYYLSPLWPFAVKAQLVLDGKSPVLLDLQDYSRLARSDVPSSEGSETVSSTVVWGAQDLDLGNHSLRIEFAQGQAESVVLDSLIYSYIAEAPAENTMSTPSSGGESIPSPPILVQRASSSSLNSQSSTPIVVGAVVGVVVATLLIGFAFLFYRYRSRLINRFPGVFHTIDEEQPQRRDRNETLPPYELRELSLSSSAKVTSPTVASAGTLPSTRSVTLAPSSLAQISLRPSLPQLDVKRLPPLPPEDEVAPSGLKQSILSVMSKRFTAAAGTPTNMSSGTASSATSSFFPRPLYGEDRPLSRQKSLPRMSTPASVPEMPSNAKVASRVGTYPGASNKEPEHTEARLPLVKPTPVVAESSSTKPQPVLSVDLPRSDPDPSLPRQSTQSPTSPTVSIYSRRKRSLNALTIIPENNGSSPDVRDSVYSGAESFSSDRSAKRRSGGRLRVAKDRQRRRRSRTPSATPLGPRPRPLPSIASYSTVSSPLPSASSGGSSQVSSPPASATGRRVRPLPPTLQDTHQSPMNQVHVTTHTADSGAEYLSPPVDWTIPALPHLPLLTPFADSNSPSWPRSGQLEHSLSLSSSLTGSHESDTPGSPPRGPLPPTPTSARSVADTANKSPRSPRRLPPKPLRLQNARSKISAVSAPVHKEDSEVQYVTIPIAPGTAPPPYSGRRIVSKPPLFSKTPSPMQRLLAREGVHVSESSPLRSGHNEKGFAFDSLKQPPYSIPATPSEKSWRISSTGHSLAGGKRMQGKDLTSEEDDVAAEMLFELIGREPGSPSTQASSMGSSIISGSSTSHPTYRPPAKIHQNSSTSTVTPRAKEENLAQTQKDERQPVARTPKFSTENELPSAGTPKLPKSPRTPFIVPPHPTTPPPIPTANPRRKIWTSESNRHRYSSVAASAPTSTLSRKRSGSDSNAVIPRDNRNRDFVPSSYL